MAKAFDGDDVRVGDDRGAVVGVGAEGDNDNNDEV